jgi:hypothetical protein
VILPASITITHTDLVKQYIAEHPEATRSDIGQFAARAQVWCTAQPTYDSTTNSATVEVRPDFGK